MNEDSSVIKYYKDNYAEHGYSPCSLGWSKGKQDVRFDILTSHYDFSGKSVLDIGCGFGDLNATLQKWGNYQYHGVDLIEDFIREARERYSGTAITFEQSDFLSSKFEMTFDYAISSGIFNLKLSGMDNYDFVDAVIDKAMKIVNDGLAFDFLSDKVDYRHEHTFHYDPAKILTMAYKYSRNVVLRNDYMPFEFTLFIFKDDSFEAYDTLFSRFKKGHKI